MTERKQKVLGSLTSSMQASTESIAVTAEEFHRMFRIAKQFAEQIERPQQDLYRQRWWDRGENLPEFVVDANKSEWWQEDGNEPPGFCGE